MSPTDSTATLAPAVEYRRAADTMRSDARAFLAIAAHVEPQPHYLTFAPVLADRMRTAYSQLADVFDEAAAQAEQVAEGIELDRA